MSQQLHPHHLDTRGLNSVINSGERVKQSGVKIIIVGETERVWRKIENNFGARWGKDDGDQKTY